jgi:hypothetical protein
VPERDDEGRVPRGGDRGQAGVTIDQLRDRGSRLGLGGVRWLGPGHCQQAEHRKGPGGAHHRG